MRDSRLGEPGNAALIARGASVTSRVTVNFPGGRFQIRGAPRMSCQLCSLLQDLTAEPWVVHEDASAVVFLHDDWATLGHAVIASKRHVENLSDLDAAERDAFVASY